jgi:hypothetical protein
MTGHTGESAQERLARNLGELLQELRVAPAGVQILFGFLLSVVFTDRFRRAAVAQPRPGATRSVSRSRIGEAAGRRPRPGAAVVAGIVAEEGQVPGDVAGAALGRGNLEPVARTPCRPHPTRIARLSGRDGAGPAGLEAAAVSAAAAHENLPPAIATRQGIGEAIGVVRPRCGAFPGHGRG